MAVANKSLRDLCRGEDPNRSALRNPPLQRPELQGPEGGGDIGLLQPGCAESALAELSKVAGRLHMPLLSWSPPNGKHCDHQCRHVKLASDCLLRVAQVADLCDRTSWGRAVGWSPVAADWCAPGSLFLLLSPPRPPRCVRLLAVCTSLATQVSRESEPCTGCHAASSKRRQV